MVKWKMNIAELPFSDVDDYPSLYVEEYTHQFKNGYIQHNLTGAFSEDPQMTSDHLLKEEIFKKLNHINPSINKDGNVGNDWEGGFDYVVIKEFLEPIEEENVKVKLTNMLHPETQESPDHMSRVKLLEQSNSSNMIITKSVNFDQESGCEDAIMEDTFEDVDG